MQTEKMEGHMQIPDHLSTRRLRRGNLGSIEQDEYCNIIAAFLYLAGGQDRRQKIINTIHNVYSTQMTGADYELLQSQSPPKERWIHNIDWAKRKLVQQGILLVPARSPYGTWVLSDEGIKCAAAFINQK
jgi:hypothetical protein